ncbi:PAS domain S-box protein [Oxynema sp. CENA135]|uniref:PAS domain S-box protein n=1 Tax=Oxynema sp. CENA135 TaxID=984206 RepID=UPI00190A3995|nr:PAS domain S-box protein [Oxynema sp. CENA135]MBK4730294.1 PAS domain S-box protein [Oxynema sp. CENA135]
MSDHSPVQILLVEDNNADAELLETWLFDVEQFRFNLTRACRLSEAIAHVENQSFDIILLDLSLPDSCGLETLHQLQQWKPSSSDGYSPRSAIALVPTIVLTGLDDEDVAIAAIHCEAQDYLVKGRFDGQLLVKSIRYAIERSSLSRQLKHLSEQLEYRVKERTAELEDAIASLEAEIRIRNQIEAALENSYNLLNGVVENSIDAIYVKNSEGCYLLGNASLGKALGCSVRDLFGKDDSELLPSEIAATLKEHDREVVETGESRTFEEPIPVGGQWRIFSSNKSPYRNSKGEIVGSIGICRDLTDRVEMERQLKNFAEKQALLIEHTPLAAIEWNENLEIVAWNPSAERIFGYSREEAIGADRRLLFPDTEIETDEAIAILGSIGADGMGVVREHVTRDGQPVICEWYSTPIYQGGETIAGAISLILDISDRVRQEREIRDNEAEFRALFAAMNDIVIVLDDRGYCLKVAPTQEQLLYKPPEELVGKTLHEIFPIALAEEFLNYIQTAIASQTPVKCEYWLPIGDRDICFDATISPMSEHTAIWVARDITDRQNTQQELQQYQNHLEELVRERTAELECANAELQAQIERRQQSETALRQSEKRFRAIVEGTTVPLVITRKSDGTIFYTNQLFCELVGLSLSEAIGRSVRQFYADPDDRPRLLRRVERDGYVHSYELQFKQADGMLYWAMVSMQSIDFEGEDALLATFYDITQRKRIEEALAASERQYRYLVETSRDLIWSVDAQGCWTFLNPVARSIYGYDVEEMLGRPFSEFARPEQAQKDLEIFAGLLAGEHQSLVYETRHRRKDGRAVDLCYNVVVVRDRDGAIVGTTGTATDITERKRVEEALKFTQFSVDHAGDAICWATPEGRFLFVNESLCRYFGYTREELLNLSIADLDIKYGGDRWDEQWQNLKAAKTLTMETIGQTKAGTQRPFEVVANYLEYQGQEYLCAFLRDIGDRQEAERKLRDREQFLRSIWEGAGIPIFVLEVGEDGEFRYAGVNPIAAAESPIPAEQLLGRTSREVLPPEIADPWNARYRECCQTGEPISFEEALVVGENCTWFLATLTPLRDGEGRIDRLICTAIDITDRRLADRALQESREQLDNILRSLDDIVWSTSADNSQIFYLNEAFEGVYGRSVAEIRDNPSIWFEAIAPEDREGLETQGGELWQKGSHDREYQIVRPDGERRWIRDRARVIRDDNGTPVRIDGIATDITERKTYEAALDCERRQLREIVARAPVAMAMFDRQWRYLAYSDRWVEEYHLGDQSLVGRTLEETLPELARHWADPCDRALNGEAISHPEDCLEIDEARRIYLRWAIQPWYASAGEVGGIAIATHIIDELVEAREAALQTARLKAQFLANMSHEIRTPMNGVLGMTELLLHSSLTPQQRDIVETLRLSGQNLLTLINDILDFSKLEAGEMRLEMRPFDLAEGLEELLNLFGPQAQAKGIGFAIVLDPQVNRDRRADLYHLKQILSNLLGNAVKFTQRGQIVLRVRNAATPPADRTATVVRFEVSDTGIGIDRQNRDRLFTCFSQVDPSTTREYGGTGLGLAIAKQLVDLMGGEIGLESEPGRGSTFWFEVPLERERDAEPNPEADCLPGRRLLAVRERAADREAIAAWAAYWGVEVREAADLRQALAMVYAALTEERPFDFLAIDWAIVKSTPKLLERLLCGNAALARTAAIAIGPFAEIEPLQALLNRGFAGYAIEPLVPSRLLQCLRGEVVSPLPAPGQPRSPGDSVPSASAQENGGSPLVPSSGLKVLLVEDTPINQKVVRGQLELLGIAVEVACNGREALDRLARERYDLVLMDCQMPVLDGYDATRQLRDREASAFAKGLQRSQENREACEGRTTVVGLTAYAMKGDREKCLAAGMDDYLSKPVTVEELEGMLRRWTPWQASEGIRESSPQENRAPVAVSSPPDPPLRGASLQENRAIPVDLAHLQKVSRGDRDFQRELLTVFLNDCNDYLAALKQGLTRGDAPQVARAAHQIKGASLSVGIRTIPDWVTTLEEDARQGNLTRTGAIATAIEAALERLRLWVAQFESLPGDAEAIVLQSRDPIAPAPELPPPPPPEPIASPPPSDPDECPVDRDRLDALSRGDREFQIELLQAFMDDASGYLAHLKAALAASDAIALARHAHQLKGSSATVAIRSMPEVASAIEQMAKQNQLAPVPNYMKELETIFERVRVFLRSLQTGNVDGNPE